MKDRTNDLTSTPSVTGTNPSEELWQTLAGCAALFAGLLALCWML